MPFETSSFEAYREHVEDLVRDGEPLECVEEMLESAPLAPEDRDALWLLGWGLTRSREESDPLRRRPSRRLAAAPERV